MQHIFDDNRIIFRLSRAFEAEKISFSGALLAQVFFQSYPAEFSNQPFFLSPFLVPRSQTFGLVGVRASQRAISGTPIIFAAYGTRPYSPSASYAWTDPEGL